MGLDSLRTSDNHSSTCDVMRGSLGSIAGALLSEYNSVTRARTTPITDCFGASGETLTFSDMGGLLSPNRAAGNLIGDSNRQTDSGNRSGRNRAILESNGNRVVVNRERAREAGYLVGGEDGNSNTRSDTNSNPDGNGRRNIEGRTIARDGTLGRSIADQVGTAYSGSRNLYDFSPDNIIDFGDYHSLYGDSNRAGSELSSIPGSVTNPFAGNRDLPANPFFRNRETFRRDSAREGQPMDFRDLNDFFRHLMEMWQWWMNNWQRFWPPQPNPRPEPRPNPTPEPRPTPVPPRPEPRPNPTPPPDRPNPPTPPPDRPEPPTPPDRPPSADLNTATDRLSKASEGLSAADKSEIQRRQQECIQECRKRGLSDSEIAKTLDETSRLLEAQDRAGLPGRSARVAAAKGILANASDPDKYVNQGGHLSCNVTTIEERAYDRRPATAAKMVADCVLTGGFTSSDGRRIELHPDALAPDPEARTNQLMGENRRSYASQIFQAAALTDLGDRNPGRPVKYIPVGGPAQSGEGWIDPATGQKWAFNGLTMPEIEQENRRINGDTGVCRAGFGSPEELRQWLAANPNKPLILGVNGRDPLFYGDHTRSDGSPGGLNHVVTVRYNPQTDRVFVSNQWGADMDFECSVDLLWQAT